MDRLRNFDNVGLLITATNIGLYSSGARRMSNEHLYTTSQYRGATVFKDVLVAKKGPFSKKVQWLGGTFFKYPTGIKPRALCVTFYESFHFHINIQFDVSFG